MTTTTTLYLSLSPSLFSFFLGFPRSRCSIPSLKSLWYDLLLLTFEDLGSCFIKFGQWTATRPDVFEDDLCECLSRLHLEAPAHSSRTTRRVIEQAYRRPIADVFEEFDETPIASGMPTKAPEHQPTRVLSWVV
jgi:aarF domain-containing kinase